MSKWVSFSLPNPFKSDDPYPPADDQTASSSKAMIGIKNDLVEIGGSLSRFASSFFTFRNDGVDVDDDEDTLGITDQVVDFVREISLKSQCWTDHFPLSLPDDFNMSEVQRDHAATIEHLVPSLVALRHELHSYFSDEQFWMMYFILLLPRLNENDSKLLSTPEIVETRETLLKKLLKKRNAAIDAYQDDGKINSTQGSASTSQQKEAFAEVVNALQETEIDDHGNNGQWLEDEDDDTCTSVYARKQPENEEEVSFSDLDDDDNDLSGRLSSFKHAKSNKVSSTDESSEWVRLGENSGAQGGWTKAGQSTSPEKDSECEDSNDWLTVDNVDLDS